MATLTSEAPRAIFAVPRGAGGRLRFDVVAIDNPDHRRFSIRIGDANRGTLLQQVALYPADQPGSFEVPVPDGTSLLSIEAKPEGNSLPTRIVVRLSAD